MSGLSLSGGQQQRLCIARTVAIRPEVILLDEPCSALDPISTAKIEELIDVLKHDYTIAIVTHNMQQAARISDFTAFMYLGELVEFDETTKIFTNPNDSARRTTSLAASDDLMTEHTAKAFDTDLEELARKIAKMGGLAEKVLGESIDALERRDRSSPRSPSMTASTQLSTRSRSRRS